MNTEDNTAKSAEDAIGASGDESADGAEAASEREASNATSQARETEGETDDLSSDDELEGEDDEEEEEGEVVFPGDDDPSRPGLERSLFVTDARLASVLESLIFVADGPVKASKLARLARRTAKEVKSALKELEREYAPRGIQLVKLAGGYQFRSSMQNAPFVREFVSRKPVRLSRAQMEALSIVAYRQPVTRPEIDEIRGVDSGSSLRALADRDLVKILGRKEEPGRPLLYGTTPGFLEFFGLAALKDLPTLKEFTELSDESRGIFERRMGDKMDLSEAEREAAEAEGDAQEAMFGDDEAQAEAEDGARGASEDGDAPRDVTAAAAEDEAEDAGGATPHATKDDKSNE